ncbi:nucleobase-ascorbate transporter 5-like isoform X1 [Vicia villosa]|uniref:nucleobase-ascorbate transporter 5-like isoform X1 n=1 Tax=Vicia villosa TaxID=3911 RepID=UPI00273B7C9E|nr:nucleobase-ascorbate transporter 5-like isoform X1 [Vicia villosa]
MKNPKSPIKTNPNSIFNSDYILHDGNRKLQEEIEKLRITEDPQVEKAQMIQTLLFVGGIKTLLQTWFGTRLPVVVGASFSFLIPAISVALSTRMSVFPDPHERFRMVLVVSHGALMEVLLVLRLLNI